MLGPLSLTSSVRGGRDVVLISQNLETREVWDLSKVALFGWAGSRVRATNEYSILRLSNQWEGVAVHQLPASPWATGSV